MARLLDVFQHKDLASEPGSRYSYSNSAYVVLAHLLETVSGVSFEEYLQANIFDPVRMDDTGVDHIGRSSRTGPTGTSEDGIINTWWLDMYLLTGSGNLYSTVRDLLKWDQALYTETVLTQPTLHETYQHATLNNGNETAYGLVWRLGGQRAAHHRSLGKYQWVHDTTPPFHRSAVHGDRAGQQSASLRR